MKKRLLLLALPLVAAVGCSIESSKPESIPSGSSESIDLPKGGDDISIADSSAVDTFATDMAGVAQKAVKSVGDGFGISGKFTADVLVATPATSSMQACKVAVDDFGFDYDFAVSKLSGKKLSEVDAALNITNLNAKVDVDLEPVISIPQIKAELKNSKIGAYLDNKKLYLDASDKGITDTVKGVMTTILAGQMGEIETSGWGDSEFAMYNSQMEAAVSQMTAGFGNYKLALTEFDEMDIPNFDTLLPGQAALAGLISGGIEDIGATSFAKLFKAVKYESGAYGFEINVDLPLLKELTAYTDDSCSTIVEEYEGMEKFEVKVTMLTDAQLRLSKIGAKFALEGDIAGAEIKVGLEATANFDYAATVTLPNDLATYITPELGM